MKNHRLFIPLTLLVLASLACRLFIPEKTSTPAPAQEITQVISKETLAPPTTEAPQTTSTGSPKTTQTSAATTAADTQAPTPTPRGFYSHSTAGFSFNYPTNWFLDQEGDRAKVQPPFGQQVADSQLHRPEGASEGQFGVVVSPISVPAPDGGSSALKHGRERKKDQSADCADFVLVSWMLDRTTNVMSLRGGSASALPALPTKQSPL